MDFVFLATNKIMEFVVGGIMKLWKGIFGLGTPAEDLDTAAENDPDIELLEHPERYRQQALQKELERCRKAMDTILEKRARCAKLYRKVCAFRKNGLSNMMWEMRQPWSKRAKFECDLDWPGYFDERRIGMKIVMDAEYYIVLDVARRGRLHFLAADRKTEFKLEDIASTPYKAQWLYTKLWNFNFEIQHGLDYDVSFTMKAYKAKLKGATYDE